jgi:hypothetical protein
MDGQALADARRPWASVRGIDWKLWAAWVAACAVGGVLVEVVQYATFGPPSGAPLALPLWIAASAPALPAALQALVLRRAIGGCGPHCGF